MTGMDFLQILMAMTGSIGFALIFGMHGKQLPVSAVGSGLTWLVCLCGTWLGMDAFWSCFLASLFGSLFSAVAARVLKTPKTAFFLAVLIALIPGSSLYRTMRYAVDRNTESFFTCGMETVLCACAIASGMIAVLVLDSALRKLAEKRHSKV